MVFPLLGYGITALNALRAAPMVARGVQMARTGLGAAKSAYRASPGAQKVVGGLGKAYRKTEPALLGYGLYEGSGEMAEGVKEGDLGKFLLGASYAVPGAAYGPRSLAKGYRGTLGGIRSVLGSTKPTTKVGKAIYNRPLTTGFGLAGAGLAANAVLGEPVDAKSLVSQTQSDIEAYKKKVGRELNDKEKQQAQQFLTKAYEADQKAGIETDITLQELTKPYVFNTPSGPVVNEANVPSDKNGSLTGGPMNKEEAEITAKNQENAAKAGKKFKDKILSKANSEEADQFNKFYNRIQNLTGGNEDTNNLLMMKFAMGLLRGKTGQSGVRGFLDVAGQAGSETADTAIALFSKERDRRNDLAVAFLKAKEKNVGTRAITDKREKITIDDPQAFGGKRVVYKTTFKDTGEDAMLVNKYDANGNITGVEAVPMTTANYRIVKESPARLAKLRAQLGSLALGYQLTQEVTNLSDKAIGGSAVGLSAAEDLFGFVGNVGELFGFKDLDSFDSDVDQAIIDNILTPPTGPDGQPLKLTQEQQAETNAIIKQYNDEMRDLKSGLKPGQKTLDELTKAKLIETRMKYILANANKDEDRLTQADINEAAKNTELLKLFSSDEKIRSQYKQLSQEIQNRFKLVVANYLESGGNPEFVTKNFGSMPYVADWSRNAAINREKSKIQDSITNILTTIK